VEKIVSIREQAKIELRGEFFNAFNHVQFGLPSADTDLASTSDSLIGEKSQADSVRNEAALLSSHCACHVPASLVPQAFLPVFRVSVLLNQEEHRRFRQLLTRALQNRDLS
jgi:hypothetical protein